MNTKGIHRWYDQKQAKLISLHKRQVEIAEELVPLLAGKQLALLVELVDIYGELSSFQDRLVDDCCEMIDTLMLRNKKMLQNQKPQTGEKPAG